MTDAPHRYLSVEAERAVIEKKIPTVMPISKASEGYMRELYVACCEAMAYLNRQKVQSGGQFEWRKLNKLPRRSH